MLPLQRRLGPALPSLGPGTKAALEGEPPQMTREMCGRLWLEWVGEGGPSNNLDAGIKYPVTPNKKNRKNGFTHLYQHHQRRGTNQRLTVGQLSESKAAAFPKTFSPESLH